MPKVKLVAELLLESGHVTLANMLLTTEQYHLDFIQLHILSASQRTRQSARTQLASGSNAPLLEGCPRRGETRDGKST